MRFLYNILIVAAISMSAYGQEIAIDKALFNEGDSQEWKTPSFDDSSWKTLEVTRLWDDQGVAPDTRFGWYRFHIDMPSSMLQSSDLQEVVAFDLGMVDDCDEAYFNGKLIGKTGLMPGEMGDITNTFDIPRNYTVSAKDVNWDGENVLAVRCYSGGAPGGMFGGPVKVTVPGLVEAADISFSQAKVKGKDGVEVTLKSRYPATISGKLNVVVTDFENGKVVAEVTKNVKVNDVRSEKLFIPYNKSRRVDVKATFDEKNSGKSLSVTHVPHYILTPAAPASPRFNTAPIYGVRPGSPIHYRFGVSGERPMHFSSTDLPKGLAIDPYNGALRGSLEDRGSYTFTVTAKNAAGEASQEFTIKVGDRIGLTPPMGWNSWNCWGLSVSQDKVLSSAKALIDNGLADYGYAYVNIDDGWEAEKRNPDGTIAVNSKFPDMKGLGDWLHDEGLKFGIYSSPGDLTCGGYLGSLDHEAQDADSYNEWGIDYLKYDWCGYSRKHETEPDRETTASYIRPYLLMQEHLRRQPRDIFYSLCQYGMGDVWKWGEMIDANSWRTTGDISDRWDSVYDIGFVEQADLYPYAAPGGWNDPDMLVVGKVGWSSNLRDSRLTVDEQYTHISLWALMAANMMIGCDLAQLDDFTLSLLCNNEVNAVNQDVLGKQAKRDVKDGDLQIWSRPLSDGSVAVGIFNLGDGVMEVDLNNYLKILNIDNPLGIRDLWRQQDLALNDTKYKLPSHGVKLIKVKK
ncbi:MAG: putative Ig domain-containing protein [Muribaculaceae bacterium]|nr:putative Ig domain-containing protein [Muribaculaceae bacterium]